jgi:hypothetical protein
MFDVVGPPFVPGSYRWDGEREVPCEMPSAIPPGPGNWAPAGAQLRAVPRKAPPTPPTPRMPTMPFGKFKGQSIGYVAEVAPGYLKWFSTISLPPMVKQAVDAELAKKG